MKFAIAVDEREYSLEFSPDTGAYRLEGEIGSSGTASVVQVSPEIYSIFLGSRSFTVHLARNGAGVETWTGTTHNSIILSDTRDRSGKAKAAGAGGPLEVKAQMPGKVVKVLVKKGDAVENGQGLIVIEAMKMQNEMKSRKTGTITRVHAHEGATVAAGEILMVVE